MLGKSVQKKTTCPSIVLFYISTIRSGGAARAMVNLSNALVKAGHQVILVTNFSEGNEYCLDKRILRFSLEKTESTQHRLLKNYTRIRALHRLIKQHAPHACVSFMVENNFRLTLASLGLRTRTIVSVRNDPKKEYRGKLGYLIGKYLFRLVDGVVFQTAEAQAWFPKAIQNKSTIIANLVAEKFYQVKRSSRPQHIVTCGRLHSQKNHTLLIRAFAKLADKYSQENLLIYGTGELESSLKQLIEQLGLQNRVFLMGQREDISCVLAEAKLFVLSSDYEGMPNALMEALAAGVPSISTDCPCGGPRELIRHGKNGLLVPCNDENALVKAMDSILSNSQLATTLSQNVQYVAQQFKPEIIVKQWEEFLQKRPSC